MRFGLLILVLCFSLPICSANQWQLVYSANMQGELKPCGCSEKGNLGGVLRRATQLRALRKSGLETVVVSSGDIIAEADEQGIIKTRYIFQAFAAYDMDAILPGERELNHGEQGLLKANLPWVLSNASNKSRLVRSRLKTFANGQRLIILGVMDPDMGQFSLTDPNVAIHEQLRQLSANDRDTVLLLVHGDEHFIQSLALSGQVDIIVKGHLQGPVPRAITRMNWPYLLAAGHRGQRLGVAKLSHAAKPELFDSRIIDLPSTVADHPSLIVLYQDYDQAITRWYREKSKKLKQAASEQSPYAGGEICKECHRGVAKSWQKSRHASAMQSLQRDAKDQDPECLMCHTTGMGQRGGFISHDINPQLENVQCEACHGAARKHAEYPRRYRPENGFIACKTCHSKENSPDFQLSVYWKQIAHGKSGRLPFHQQDISALVGSYEIIAESKNLVPNQTTELVEFFNFYCSRCYVLNAGWESIVRGLRQPVKHVEMAINIGENQEPWASLAWFVARAHGVEKETKEALFAARFEKKMDLNDKQAVLEVVRPFGIVDKLKQAMTNPDSNAWREYKQAQVEKDKWDVHETPAVIINKQLKVTPSNSADNTNLMLENLNEIVLDLQCRRTAVCE